LLASPEEEALLSLEQPAPAKARPVAASNRAGVVMRREVLGVVGVIQHAGSAGGD
jgi:hypothetical protein